MIVYKASDGTVLLRGQAFINPVTKVKFPANWFDYATDADLVTQGITKTIVSDPIPLASTVFSASSFRALFTPAELAALTTLAQTNVIVAKFLSDVNAAGTVDLTSEFIVNGMRAIINLTPVVVSMARAAQILSGQAPL